jgi:predicted DNA-binding transcriptional regulator YafY
MRADRLVATPVLLQVRGRMTAAEVAAELEVSERTARRDLDALGMAGIPVCASRGRGGGWELLGGARTDPSGLSAAEAAAAAIRPRTSTIAGSTARRTVLAGPGVDLVARRLDTKL